MLHAMDCPLAAPRNPHPKLRGPKDLGDGIVGPAGRVAQGEFDQWFGHGHGAKDIRVVVFWDAN